MLKYSHGRFTITSTSAGKGSRKHVPNVVKKTANDANLSWKAIGILRNVATENSDMQRWDIRQTPEQHAQIGQQVDIV
jgi:hypothetical protein